MSYYFLHIVLCPNPPWSWIVLLFILFVIFCLWKMITGLFGLKKKAATTAGHYSAFVTILRILKGRSAPALKCSNRGHAKLLCACVHCAYQMKTEQSGNLQRRLQRRSVSSMGIFTVLGCSERPPYVCWKRPDVELYSIKSLINLWEYNFSFWWID